MKRVLLAFVSTVTGLVMLLSFKTHSIAATTSPASKVAPSSVVTTQSGTAATPTTTPTAAAGARSSTTASTPATKAGATTKTVTGSSVDTRYGPVQVQIVITDGKITSATAVQYPSGNGRDQEINSYAVPTLQQESVQANSANIDMVSGATYTSNGYISSLQSALSKV